MPSGSPEAGKSWPITQLYPASTTWPTTWQAWLNAAAWRGTEKGKTGQTGCSGKFLKIKCINMAVSGLPKIPPWEYSGPCTKAGYSCCMQPMMGQPKGCGICSSIPKVLVSLQHQLQHAVLLPCGQFKGLCVCRKFQPEKSGDVGIHPPLLSCLHKCSAKIKILKLC